MEICSCDRGKSPHMISSSGLKSITLKEKEGMLYGKYAEKG